MGPSAYDKLGCAVSISNSIELTAAFTDPRPPHLKDAVAFGLRMMRRGFKFRFTIRTGEDAFIIGGSHVAESGKIVKDLSYIRRNLKVKRLRGGKWGMKE